MDAAKKEGDSSQRIHHPSHGRSQNIQKVQKKVVSLTTETLGLFGGPQQSWSHATLSDIHLKLSSCVFYQKHEVIVR